MANSKPPIDAGGGLAYVGAVPYVESRLDQLVDLATTLVRSDGNGIPPTFAALRAAVVDADRSAFEAGFDAAVASLHIPNVLFTHPKYIADRARLYLDYVRARRAVAWDRSKPSGS